MQSATINGVEIGQEAILAETQNHPSSSPDQAWANAVEALAVKELLVQEARRTGLVPAPETDRDGRREADDHALIRQLLDAELSVPEADEATCRRYYDGNRNRFKSLDLFEAAHILFAASPDDDEAYQSAVDRATLAIAQVENDSSAFDRIAKTQSDCTSGKDGGRLGQVSRGDTVSEFETFLVALDDGQLCPVPVKSRYGAHVLRLDHKIEGRQLPFEAVQTRIADYLQEASWRRAVAQYVQLLAGRARIEGIQMNAATSPLVQ
jgi:peptidyl-prolyl cis-trans isomerase C